MIDHELVQAIGELMDEKFKSNNEMIDEKFKSNNEMMDEKFKSNNEMMFARMNNMMDEKFKRNNDMMFARMNDMMDERITATENMILSELDRVQEMGTRHYNELKKDIQSIRSGKDMLDSDALRMVITHTGDLEERVRTIEKKIG